MNKTIRNLFIMSFLISLFASAIRPAHAQTGIEIIENSATLDFPNDITFNLEFKSPSPIKQVNLLYGAEGKSCNGGLARQKVDFTAAGDTITAEWVWDFHKTDSLPVGVKVDWQWEIVDSNGVTTLIDPKTITIGDDSQNWKSVSGDGITVMELSHMLMISAPTTSRMIDGLCSKGLLEKEKDAQDHRVTRLRLSAQSQGLLKALTDLQDKILLEVFAEEDAAELEKTVSHIGSITDKWLEIAGNREKER